MIIFRYLLAEVLKVTFAILGILMLIFISQQFVRFLGDFAEGQISGWMVLQLLGLQIPVIFSFLLPLSLFLGVLLGFGRLYVDAEITVLRACGVGQSQMARYGLIPCLALAFFTGILTLYLAPWATEKQYDLIDERAASADLFLLQPGKFQPSSDGSNMFFVKSVDGGRLEDVFVARITSNANAPQTQQLDITTARTGLVKPATELEPATMSLGAGAHYQLVPGQNNLVHDRFQRLYMRLSDSPIKKKQRKQKAVTTAQLLTRRSPRDWAELQWRLSVPLSMPLLFLLAIPLSRVKPRQGKFAKVLPGVIIYALYMVALLSVRSGLEKGDMPAYFGLWWVHIAMFGFIYWLFRRESRQ